MAGHAQLKFVMTECSKTQIRLTGLIWSFSCGLQMTVTSNFFKLKLSPFELKEIAYLS